MTRDEFMKEAEQEINNCFITQRNRMMNVVERAWAEGKKNAEMDRVTEIVRKALENAGAIEKEEGKEKHEQTA